MFPLRLKLWKVSKVTRVLLSIAVVVVVVVVAVFPHDLEIKVKDYKGENSNDNDGRGAGEDLGEDQEQRLERESLGGLRREPEEVEERRSRSAFTGSKSEETEHLRCGWNSVWGPLWARLGVCPRLVRLQVHRTGKVSCLLQVGNE